jgi:hypothetical protein
MPIALLQPQLVLPYRFPTIVLKLPKDLVLLDSD